MRAYLILIGAAGVAFLGACAGETSGPTTGSLDATPSVAYLTWVPGAGDNCTIEVHNRYRTVGPGGKLYPTWHPPVDPATGCSFGHEHGRDPHGSDLYGSVGDIPFGYANEMLDTWDPSGRRHEDHVGHKVEWENDVPMSLDGIANEVLNLRCDIMTKLHQGTHSKDAFTNNVHELVYHIKCTDGTEMHITTMNPIGTPGRFTRSCDGATIVVGTANPANSPNGGGQRVIPDRTCVDRHVLVASGQTTSFSNGIHESWQTNTSIRTEAGHTVASFDPYYQVNMPSRFHDPGLADLTGRTISVCYEVEANGDRARSTVCNAATANGVHHQPDPGGSPLPVQRRLPLCGHQRESGGQRRRPQRLVYRSLRQAWAHHVVCREYSPGGFPHQQQRRAVPWAPDRE